MNGVVLIAMEMFLAMVFFHFHKVAVGAIVEEYGVLDWLKLRYVGKRVAWFVKQPLNLVKSNAKANTFLSLMVKQYVLCNCCVMCSSSLLNAFYIWKILQV